MTIRTPLLMILLAGGCGPADDSGRDCPDTADTADETCGGGNDTDDVPTAPVTGTVVPSSGPTTTFTSSQIVGGWNETDWGFTASGSDPTNALSFSVAGAPGTGTYGLLTPDDDSFATYTDLQTFGVMGGGFVSTSGTLVVTRWEETTATVDRAFLADGTFDVQLTNAAEPTPITLHVSGSFHDITLVGE